VGRKNIKAEADGKTDKAALLQELGRLRRQFQELTQSLKQFKELFDNAVVGVYRTTPDGRIIMANSAFVQMLGYSSFEELSKRNVEEEGFVPGYPRSTFKELIEKEGKVVGLESSLTRKDGTTIFIRENARIVCGRSGKTMYYEGVVEDITERKKTEDELKQYQLMVESAQDAIFFKDLKSRYIVANKKTLEAFGLSGEKVIGKNDYEIMPDKEEAKKNIDDDNIVFKTGKPKEIIKQMTGTDGKHRWFQALKVPHFDDKGNIIGLIGIARDITKRKRNEDELKILKQQTEFILGVTKTGLDIIDSQFNIRYIDPEWQKVYGDPTGKKCYEYFMDRSQVCPGCGIPKSLQTKSITVSEEILVKENNRPIQVTTIPFQNEKGEWLVAEVNVDISERKKAEEVLRTTLDATTESVLLVDKQLKVLTQLPQLDK
jgi:PAS domain S-box-containing protein